MNHALLISRRALLAVAATLAAGSISGCVPLIVGGAAATATVVSDRRNVQEQANDKNINANVNSALKKQFGDNAMQAGDTARINSNAYLGVVLLTGDAFSEKAKAQAGEIAGKIDGVKSVSNQIHVGPISSFGDVASDTWLTSKVKATLATTNEVPSRAISVTSHLGVVYLMGMVTQRERDLAAAATSTLSGVSRVEKLFKIISVAEARRLDNFNQTSGKPAPIGEGATGESPAAASPGGTANQGAPAGGAVELMPVK